MHLRSLIGQFGLETLRPMLAACETLAGGADAPLDVAVVGQFKSGKSSLLNAVLGDDLLPVGVLPVTSVVTRVSGGPQLAARVTRLDGSVEAIEPAAIADFVAESRNPNNRRQVAVVDVFTPALADLSSLRLVDTPGLGSVFTHNTRCTHDWLPNVAIALVAISADRPFSDEDRRLIAELRPHAPRIAVMLTKVDLLGEAQRQDVLRFVNEQLEREGGADVGILFFSTREQPGRWVTLLKNDLLRPLAADAVRERQRTLAHKFDSLTRACREYLTVALDAAQRAEDDRQRLAAAVLDESIKEPVIRDELGLASARLIGSCRPAFEKTLLGRRDEIQRRLTGALLAEMPRWRGHLAAQTAHFEAWIREHLYGELEAASRAAIPAAADLLVQAEDRLRRVAEAFRDRLSHNVNREMGLTLSPVAWTARRPPFIAPPVTVGQTFMIRWELLWWLIPMAIVGGLFRWHCASRVPWEVEKNLMRLVSDWSEATGAAMVDLQGQAVSWVQGELATLTSVLDQRPDQIANLRAELANLDASRHDPSASR